MDIYQTTPISPYRPTIKTVILDDEIGAINTLKQMLASYCPSVEVLLATVLVSEATTAVSVLRPDLVFLDIEMPPFGTGFDFLNRFTEINFGVIFTTAYAEYAVKAINSIQPWAYLIKPYSIIELKSAIGIAEEKMSLKNNSTLLAAQNQGMVIHDSRKGALVILASEILFCKADGSFTDFIIHKNGKTEKITASGNLKSYEKELPSSLFCRTHHGYLVNMMHIDRIVRTGRNATIHHKYSPLTTEVSVAKMDHFNTLFQGFLKQGT
jgi:two-component system, LytTR family, response regulator